jgi:acyl-CoA hydrolase
MPHESIRHAPLRDKITDPPIAADFIKDGDNLLASGSSLAGYSKLIPGELAKRAKAGESFRINLLFASPLRLASSPRLFASPGPTPATTSTAYWPRQG